MSRDVITQLAQWAFVGAVVLLLHAGLRLAVRDPRTARDETATPEEGKG